MLINKIINQLNHKVKKHFAIKKLNQLNTTNKNNLNLQIDRFFQHIGLSTSLIHTKLLLPYINKIYPSKEIKILLIGPCNSYEINEFEKFGYKNIHAIDLVSTDPRITVMDMHNIEYEDKFFDLVYSTGVIQCSHNPQQVGTEICRVLKPKGVAVIGVAVEFEPNEYYVTDFKDLNGILQIFPNPKPEVLYSETEQPITDRNPHGTQFLKCILRFKNGEN